MALSCRGQSSHMDSPEPNHTGPSFGLPKVLPPVPPRRNAKFAHVTYLNTVKYFLCGTWRAKQEDVHIPLVQQVIISPQNTRAVSIRCPNMSILITCPCVTTSGGRSICVVTNHIRISIFIPPSGVTNTDCTCGEIGQ